MKYGKKPVIIDAFQWTCGPDQEEDPLWIVEALKNGTAIICIPGIEEDGEPYMKIKTLEDNEQSYHYAEIGDYIIRGVKGEIYPCRADIFKMTYDPVE